MLESPRYLAKKYLYVATVSGSAHRNTTETKTHSNENVGTLIKENADVPSGDGLAELALGWWLVGSGVEVGVVYPSHSSTRMSAPE